jgi:excisionase family DNA binding protein
MARDNPQAVLPRRCLRIPDAANYLSATNWFVETLVREGTVRSFILGKRRVIDVKELDRFVDELAEAKDK